MPGSASLTSRNLPAVVQPQCVGLLAARAAHLLHAARRPVTFSQVSRVPASSLILNTRAPNSGHRAGVRVSVCRPRSSPSSPSSRSAAPKNTGNTCRRAIAVCTVSAAAAPVSSTSFISGSLHRASASGSGAAEKSTHPSPNRPRSSRRRTAASAPGRSILLTNTNVGTR